MNLSFILIGNSSEIEQNSLNLELLRSSRIVSAEFRAAYYLRSQRQRE